LRGWNCSLAASSERRSPPVHFKPDFWTGCSIMCFQKKLNSSDTCQKDIQKWGQFSLTIRANWKGIDILADPNTFRRVMRVSWFKADTTSWLNG
jgi:hypothetical protein